MRTRDESPEATAHYWYKKIRGGTVWNRLPAIKDFQALIRAERRRAVRKVREAEAAASLRGRPVNGADLDDAVAAILARTRPTGRGRHAR